jgi:predicted hotdog family 3-hydroxylacyl-ACP dehydratase
MIQQQLPITDVSELIPQKTPFVMVDTLLDFSSNHVISSFKILENNLFLKNNVLLESGLIENMAQTVALHTGYDFFLKNETAPTGYIGSIKKIDILKLPLLNDIITTKVDILHEFNGVTMVAVKVFNAVNEEIASGEMKTVIAN